MFRSLRGCRDKGKVDVRCGGGRKLLFRFLSSLFQSLKSHLVIGEIHALRPLELSQHIVGDLLIKIVAAQLVVAGCRQHFNYAVADLNNGHVERTAAQVINHDLLLFFIVQAISQGCRRRLVDNTLYIQTSDFTGVFSGLTLSVIKIGRNRDDCLRHFLAQIPFCICFQLLQYHGRNFLRRILLIIDGHAVITAHMSLNRSDCFIRICYGLTLSGLTHQTFACFCKRHNRRCRPCALRISDNGGLAALHNSNAAICCTQVNTDNLTHNVFLLNIIEVNILIY